MAPCIFHLSIDSLCPETEPIVINFIMQADGGLITDGSLTLKNTCLVIVEMSDSYGDGWNGNRLRVSFDDGTPAVDLTLSSGSSGTETLEIGRGVHVTLTWINGSYSYECSFVMKYEDGSIIYQSTNLSSGVLHEFDCNCNSGHTNVFDPVENLEANLEIGAVILTWDAPEGATSYTIYRNGLEIGEAVEPTYTDEVYSEIHFTYCVVANYPRGNSLPECIDVKAEMGINEAEAEFVIYPNPANSTLYINGGNTEFSYEMFNGMGQMVTNGNGQGTMEINVSNMTKGVYFLRLTTGTQVRIEKVVVK